MPRNPTQIWQDALFRAAQAMLRMKNEHAREHRIFNLWSDAIDDTITARFTGRDRSVALREWWHLKRDDKIARMDGGDRSFETFKQIAAEGCAALRAHPETQNRIPSS